MKPEGFTGFKPVKQAKPMKIKVKDLEAFMKDMEVLYASGTGKRFYVLLRSGPNVERYIVRSEKGDKGFTKKGEAVRYFNAL